jgi:hypothetical protein
VNRKSLQALLETEGVDPAAYRLDGEANEEALTLVIEPGGWVVFYTERGHRRDDGRFETEDEACEYLASRLLADDSNRWLLLAGPAPKDAAARGFQDWLVSQGLSQSKLGTSGFKIGNMVTSEGLQYRYWVHRARIRRLGLAISDI